MKLSDLNINEKRKDTLAHCVKGQTISQCAARMDVDYTRAWQILNVWEAKGWLYKRKTMAGKALYFLNKEVIEL